MDAQFSLQILDLYGDFIKFTVEKVDSHYTPSRMDKTKIVTTLNAGQDAEKLAHSYNAGRNAKWYDDPENNLAISYKTNMHLHHDMALHSWVFIPVK